MNAAFNKRVMADRDAHHDADETAGEMGNSNVIGAANGTGTTATATAAKAATKLSRSMTEKRKDYVRRISIKGTDSSIGPIMTSLQQYGKVNTFKSPVRTFTESPAIAAAVAAVSPTSNDEEEEQGQLLRLDVGEECFESTSDRIKRFQKIISDTQEPKVAQKDVPALFKCCLLVGYNISTDQPYVKMVYPQSTSLPQNVEQLVFPSKQLLNQKQVNQEYSLIITDNNGHQLYGYCRRVLPENCEFCLPWAYVILAPKKASGFYFKVLREIEMRHGQAEGQTNMLLRTLRSSALPEPGKFLHLKMGPSTAVTRRPLVTAQHKGSPKRLSLEANPRWLIEANLETERNGSGATVDEKTLSLITHGSVMKKSASDGFKVDEILIRRPNDLRLESTELSALFEGLGTELLLHAFASLLLERKVVLFGKNITTVSNCVLGLQTILYPFKWQYTLITILPESLLEICQAPFPVLAGTVHPLDYEIEDGLVIDLDKKVLVQHCGDEMTILPPNLRSSLLLSLEMVNLIDQGKMLSNVLIAEAFLRFFVELFANYKSKQFERQAFIRSHPTQSVNLFLEWFAETSLFRHFLNNKLLVRGDQARDSFLIDNQLEASYYALFDAKLLEKAENKTSKADQSIENVIKNCKLINKKAKTVKERFKHFFD